MFLLVDNEQLVTKIGDANNQMLSGMFSHHFYFTAKLK